MKMLQHPQQQWRQDPADECAAVQTDDQQQLRRQLQLCVYNQQKDGQGRE
jgi:hypothetical protein